MNNELFIEDKINDILNSYSDNIDDQIDILKNLIERFEEFKESEFE